MIFILHDKDELEYVSSEYNIILFTSGVPTNKNGYNYTILEELLPSREVAKCKDSKKAKSMYKDELRNKKIAIALLVYNASKSVAASFVLYSPKKDIAMYSFDFMKTLRKFIENRYSIAIPKFTNCVTRDIRAMGELSDAGRGMIDKDLRRFANG